MINEIPANPGDKRLKEACDRALEYVRELDLPPEESLEMILACIKEAGPASGIEEIMTALWRRLEMSEGRPRLFSGLPPEDCAAIPPLKRCCMISEGLDISVRHMLFRIVAGGFKPLKKLVAKPQGKQVVLEGSAVDRKSQTDADEHKDFHFEDGKPKP